MKHIKLIIIAIALIGILSTTGLAEGAVLHQGQVNSNGTLWIISYQTPTGQQFPNPYNSIHANNLTLTVFSPLTTVQSPNITVKSFVATTNTTEYENQSYTILPHQVQEFNLLIPTNAHQQEISITWDNNTVTYYVQTYQPIAFPFGNNPLGLLALIGIVMLAFTGINIGVTQAIIRRAKYFPHMSQRVWIALIVVTGLIIYQLVTQLYWEMTGQDWALWLIPLYMFNLLMILSAFPGKDQDELYIHIKETKGHDLSTGIYVLKTAPMSEEQKGKYTLQNQAGKEYIDERSYIDFLKRLIGIRIPIIMDSPELPDTMENVRSLKVPKFWKMKDRENKEHPFAEAVLLDPLSESPAISKVDREEQTQPENKRHKRKLRVLSTHLNGKHMQEAEYFLANYITASESGKEIHRLNKDLAINKAALNTKAYQFQKEIIDHVYEVDSQHSSFQDFKARQIDPKPEDKGNDKEE